MNGLPFADIIIIALIAIFIILRLRNTLGKDVGHTPDLDDLRKRLEGKAADEKVVQMNGEPVPAADEKAKKVEEAVRAAIADSGLLQGIDAIAAADPQFSISGFLEGAKAAFEWVLKAYNGADHETLKMLLAAPIYEEFKLAMDAAKESSTKTETTLVAITDAQIIGAALDKNTARVTVRFVSEQIEITRDAEGKIVAGDPSKADAVEDEWVFERDVKSRSPNWLVMDT